MPFCEGMRFAILSDIHGNSVALDAVLADATSLGPIDRYVVLGDLVAVGPDPIGVLERLDTLPNVYCTRGNTDRYVLTGERPPPTANELFENRDLLDIFRMVESSFSWTQGALASAGWLDWLAQLPIEHRIVLPDGTRLLGVHAAPGKDGGEGLRPHMAQEEIDDALANAQADLVLVGHTHWAYEVSSGTVRAVNLGSVSNPLPPDLRASYIILEADRSGYRLERRFVDYDHREVIDHCYQIKHPATSFIERLLLGQHIPSWFKRGSCAILADSQGRVALQLRDDKPGLGGADRWGLFGGNMEAGETPEQTILREIEEELEVILDPARLNFVCQLFLPTALKSHVFSYLLDNEMNNAVLHEGQRFAFVGAEDLVDGSFQGKKIVPFHLKSLEEFWQDR